MNEGFRKALSFAHREGEAYIVLVASSRYDMLCFLVPLLTYEFC